MFVLNCVDDSMFVLVTMLVKDVEKKLHNVHFMNGSASCCCQAFPSDDFPMPLRSWCQPWMLAIPVA